MASVDSVSVTGDELRNADWRTASPVALTSTWLEAALTAPSLRTYTDRTRRLYDRARERMTHTQTVWGDTLDIFAEPGVAELPLLLRRAGAVRKVLAEMPITIEEDDLIVGNSAQDGVIVRTQLPRYGTPEEYHLAKQQGSSLSAQLSHKTPYYYAVMAKGLSGIIAEVDTKLAEIVARPPSEERDEKLALFQAMKLEAQAVIALAHRYADLALALADTAATVQRRDELHAIAQVCRRVPEYPATTFHEAVQGFWLLHYALLSTGTHISCGRFDQYLVPALRDGLATGAITLDQAQEIVDCVWIRFNDRGQICRENFYIAADAAEPAQQSRSAKAGIVVDKGPQSWTAGHRKRFQYATDAADAINHFGQNLLLSGIKPDGRDGTNPLTYLCLNSLEKFAFTSPVVTIRLHRGSPPELVARAAEVLKTGSGMPYINNDDALIPAYTELGVTLPDARDYANSNCWETMIEGKSDQELIRGMNFLLFLELALHRGVSSVHGPMGPDTGDPHDFAAFDDLMAAWQQQMDFQLKTAIDYIGDGIANGTLEHSNHGKYSYNPLLSALTQDCIQNERDVIHGGARYTIWHVMGEGVANAIDALAAIKQTVYEERSLSMDELLAALDGNWAGHANLRNRLVARVPKFATDNDYADELGRTMMEFFVARTRFHARRHPHVIFPCSVGTFSWYAMIGKEVGATPDGRCAGEPIAANFSPVPGRDMCGPTAAINSYLKMDVQHLAAGAPLDLRLASGSVKGESGTQRLAGLIDTFVEMGGNMLTLTVTDVEELKRAMAEPEKYRHLRVRMGGWSAYFAMLSREQQLLHIQRVEHGLV
jgi:formate C-acetyltransferase